MTGPIAPAPSVPPEATTALPIQGTIPMTGHVLTNAQPAEQKRVMEESTTKPTAPQGHRPSTNGAASVPDFLAGFDKVASSTPKLHGMQGGAVLSSEYSPPFTSKSFDDFHRLLGKDVDEIAKPGIGSVSTPQQTMHSTASIHPRPLKLSPRESPGNGSHVPDTMALFSAESYAMFAQESALTMSHHAAYGKQEQQQQAEQPPTVMEGSNHDQSLTTGHMTEGVPPSLLQYKPETDENGSAAAALHSSTYGQVVGNPLTQFAPTMDHLKDNVTVTANIVSGSERASSSSDPMSNNEEADTSSTSRNEGGTTGSSTSVSNDDNSEEGSSDGGGEDDHSPVHKKQRRLSSTEFRQGEDTLVDGARQQEQHQ